MYRIYFYVYNNVQTQDFQTLNEAFEFWQRLPFETFRELRKI